MSEKTKTILHADLDAFYASVEQRDNPSLKGRPVAVGGRGRRGVIAAASYEARDFGVYSAMPCFQARRLCPELVLLPSNMPLYRKESARIFRIFQSFSPVVESLSLDEAFVDLTGTDRLLGSPRDIGNALRHRVRMELGLAVSVGIAPVKMVAKMASESAKPDGIIEVTSDQIAQFLNPMPVRRIWGVGRVAEKKLHDLGFYQVADLAKSNNSLLYKLLGQWGIEIGELARGEDLREVDPYRVRASYGEENTFEKNVDDLEVIQSVIRSHAETIARKLRCDDLFASTVAVKWKLAKYDTCGDLNYPVRTRQMRLPEPTSDGVGIAAAAWELFISRGPREPIRLVGVTCSNLIDGSAAQASIFVTGLYYRRNRLNQVSDAIKDRFGADKFGRAGSLLSQRAGVATLAGDGEED
ncbi:MAG: DNA polymerase IV [Acidiferrobacteraceae bacterium]|nr:DNA polymerase IV [Acidiferrobacteraceae bacterium]|tara:strand:+ start:2749 stop:3984 length:1236 start_codon:yes stop_codon:yes gene_type:complete